MKFLINIVIILSTLLMSSCGTSNLQQLNYSVNTNRIETTPNYLNSNAYTINSNMYANKDRNSHIEIKYPILQGKGYEKSNKLIETYIQSFISEMYGSDYSDLDLTMDYSISFHNQFVISIVFKGDGYVKTATHPNDWFLTLNIDLIDGKQFKLSDIYKTSDNFMKIYFDTAKKQVPERFAENNKDWFEVIEELKKNLEINTNENFKHADSFGGVQSYLTPIGLGLSMPVVFAIGDHFETEIPYSDITLYLKSDRPIDLPSVN
jgi:hypothetical protein